MRIQEQSVLGSGDGVVEILELNEEVFAVSSSSTADAAFDAVISYIQDIIMDDNFQQLQQNFMDKHFMEFDDSEENKLSYTTIFNEYIEILEKHLEQQLMERIPDFNMNSFIELLMQQKDDVPDEIFDMLLTFTDFMAFKEMILDFRAEKEGRGVNMSEGIVVTSLTPSGSNLAGSADAVINTTRQD